MIYWLTTLSGSISFQVEASDPASAFELLARSLEYDSFQAMSIDLDYTIADFQVAELHDRRKDYYVSSREHLDRQKENIVVSAFKHLRKIGGL